MKASGELLQIHEWLIDCARARAYFLRPIDKLSVQLLFMNPLGFVGWTLFRVEPR